MLKEGALSEVIWLEDLVLLSEDEVLFIDELRRSGNSYAMTLHGFGTVRFKFRHLNGASGAKVEFDTGSVTTTADGPWTRAELTFGRSSRGALVIRY